jgi:RNA polymerase sigma-70 factor, ECF subfamily
MVSSVVDAEDIVQGALAKAIEAFPKTTGIANLEAWLFRIVHNTALDFLRQRLRQQRLTGDEDIATIADPIDEIYQRQAAAAGLHTFMRLPVAERSSVILMDVLGYSLEEIGGITGSSIPAVKAALHRGRGRLRAATKEPDDRDVGLADLLAAIRGLIRRIGNGSPLPPAMVAGLHPGNVGSVLYDPNRAADGPTEGNRPELLAMH